MLARIATRPRRKSGCGADALVQRYPQSALLEEGRRRLREAQTRLSESEYKVGYFYWRNKWYPARSSASERC